MHGRLKVRSSEEQEKARKKEREAKAKHYRTITERIYTKREAGEKDGEALKLTKEVLSVNPEITTLWNYRREILSERKETMSPEEFSVLCDQELSLLEACLRVNPKAYCVWLHREWVMLSRPEPDWNKEKSLCDLFLKYDERNFHCWDYRRFVINTSKCVTHSQELAFTYDKIATNFSNYSAWHYRSKLLPLVHPNSGGAVSEEAIVREYELAQNAFFTDPDDQSAWFYHRWLLGEVSKPVQVDLLYVSPDPEPLACIVFNQPVKLSLPLVVRVGDWSTVVKEVDWPKALHVSPLPPLTSPSIITVSYDKQEVSAKGGEWWVNKEGLSPQTSTVATRSVLDSQLESCQQLLEEEPQNKWCLLTTMLLMAHLDPHKHSAEIREKAHCLMAVDPYRRLYYNDLMSQFVMKETLRECLADSSQQTINLSGKDLSRLDLVEYLVPYKTIDLSNNNLQSLPPLVCLPSVHTLILDSNNLTTLPLFSANTLQVLSIKENKLEVLSSVEATFKSLPALRVLCLQGNPLCEADGYIQQLKEMIPSLQELDGQTV